MRRRLDIASLPFLEPDGLLYSLSPQGALVPYVPDEGVNHDTESLSGGVELSSAPVSLLKDHQDYVSRARYLASGSLLPSQINEAESSALLASGADLKRTINKLTRAVSELRIGMLGVYYNTCWSVHPSVTK
jgi:hypothetical protein